MIPYDETLASLRYRGLSRLADQIEATQRFSISNEIVRAICSLAPDLLADDAGRFRPPPQSRCPVAPFAVFSFMLTDGVDVLKEEATFIVLTQDDGSVCIFSAFDPESDFGSYVPGQLGRFMPSQGDVPVGLQKIVTITVAGVCALINEPSFTEKLPLHARPVRRRLERDGKMGEARAVRVVWNLKHRDATSRSEAAREAGVALHYRRGHYRKAEPHYKGAIQLPDVTVDAVNYGWWQWIEGMWVGHPAFGVRVHDYTPRLSDLAKEGPR